MSSLSQRTEVYVQTCTLYKYTAVCYDAVHCNMTVHSSHVISSQLAVCGIDNRVQTRWQLLEYMTASSRSTIVQQGTLRVVFGDVLVGYMWQKL